MAAPLPPLVKQYVVCLNSNMLGMPYEPASTAMSPDNTMRANPIEPALHPLIRNWFGSQSPSTPHVNIDPYRRAMSLDYGYTYPLNGPGEHLINTYKYESVSAPDTNTPYTYSDGEAVGPTFGSLGLPSYDNFGFDSSTSDTLDLRFNEIGWNESLPPGLPDYSYGTTPGSVVSPYYASLLDEENRDSWNEGIPYFDRYILGSSVAPPAPIAPIGGYSQRIQSAGQIGSYDGLFVNTNRPYWLPGRGGLITLFDHTFGYTNANTYNDIDPNLPDPLSPGVTVESTYNFYVDSSPNYEDVIAPANIPECILPNFYMLQSSILQWNSSGPPQNLNAYLEQASAGTLDSYFQTLFITMATAAPSSDPAISEGYWNLYSTTLSDLNSQALTEFESKYKNIVVPLGSLDFISEQNANSSLSGDPNNPGPTGPFSALSAYPFYNKITLQPIGIPSDNDPNLGPERGTTSIPGNEDFLSGLLNPTLTSLTAAETTCFVRSLQLLIANSYNPNASIAPADNLTGLVAQDLIVDFPRRPTLSMDLNFMGNNFNEESDQPQEIQHTLGKNQPIKVCAEVDKILDDATSLRDLTLKENPYPYYYISLEKNTANATDINYSILRDTVAGPAYSTVATWENTAGDVDRGQIREAIKDYTRNLNSVFKGQLSNVSPLMYLIEKRRIPDGELSVPLSVEPVQRIFITRDFRIGKSGPSPITYYDTQIKYGVRYQYDVRVINIVFGTQYRYTNVSTDFPYTEVEYIPLASKGRALGNALGFYNEEKWQVTSLGNYLVGGPVDADGCQHNYLKLPDETNLHSGPNASLTDPTMYFSDSGELGWSSTPYQTDIGEDAGWDSANERASEDPGLFGQTGYYVFGGAALGKVAQALGGDWDVGQPVFDPWTVDYEAYFGHLYSLNTPLLQPGIFDEYGSAFDAPLPGGMYPPSVVSNMLGDLKVKVIDGLGHDGNATGGLVPWMVATPPPPDDDEPEETTGVTLCEWMGLFAGALGFAFTEWYAESRTFHSPTRDPVIAADYQWHWQGMDSELYPNVWSGGSSKNFERWWNGDSNCILGFADTPVLWDPGLGNNQASWGYEFVTNPPVSNVDAQGRNTAAWYCPNWHDMGTTAVPNAIWRPHSHYQIIYWLKNGAAAQYANVASPQYTTDTTYSIYANSSMRTYYYPKANLGEAHGNQILNEFRIYWNQNHFSLYGVDSVSPYGVQVAAGQTYVEALAAGGAQASAWTQTLFFTMIDSLYLENCMGEFKWPTPGEIAGLSGTGTA